MVRVKWSVLPVSDFRFRDSGLGSQVSGFGLQVSSFGSEISGFRFWVSDSRFWASGLELRVASFGFRFWGFRLQISGFERRTSSTSERPTIVLRGNPAVRSMIYRDTSHTRNSLSPPQGHHRALAIVVL